MMGGGGGYTPEAVRPRSGGMAGGDGDIVSQIKRWSSKAEDAIETYSQVSCLTHSSPCLALRLQLCGGATGART
jgi:hypothetical protein